jgi:serine protease AprX
MLTTPKAAATCAQFLASLGLAAATCPAHAGVVSPELERAIARGGTHADTAVIVRFAEPVNPEPFKVIDRRTRGNRLLVALKARIPQNRQTIEPYLAASGAKHVKDLWIVNGIAATLPAAAIKELADQPGVARVDLDSHVRGGRPQRMPAPHTSTSGSDPKPAVPAADDEGDAAVNMKQATPTWNVEAVQAPELWALGQTGKNVVVATMDTGADLLHPDLRRKWRGGTNSWFDPHGEEAEPYDAVGHGTQALGIILGGSALGIAPDARWIAVKLYDANGRAAMSDIHLAFQWLLDPDGDPATVDAPDVVNASWVLAGRRAGLCNLEFSDDLRMLRSAGIAVVLAAGNDGPFARTSSSPGNNPGALSVGAVDRDLDGARQNSRGPSACDGAVFPRLSAPGVNIRTTDLSYGGLRSYASVSGSSLATPHVAGVLALLAGAFPAASVEQLEDALTRSAKDLGNSGPDNQFGFGLVRALNAFMLLRDAVGVNPTDATMFGTRSGADGLDAKNPSTLQQVSRMDGSTSGPH